MFFINEISRRSKLKLKRPQQKAIFGAFQLIRNLFLMIELISNIWPQFESNIFLKLVYILLDGSSLKKIIYSSTFGTCVFAG